MMRRVSLPDVASTEVAITKAAGTEVASTKVDERTEDDVRQDRTTMPSDGSGDHDRFAHYVNKTKLTESAVTGKSVIALCGKRWVPTRDAQRYPVCPTCREIYSKLRG